MYDGGIVSCLIINLLVYLTALYAVQGDAGFWLKMNNLLERGKVFYRMAKSATHLVRCPRDSYSADVKQQPDQ